MSLRPFAAVLLAATVASSCVEHAGTGSAPVATPAAAAGSMEPTPVRTPAPLATTVPASLACTQEADCVASQFTQAISSATSCPCPACPAPMRAEVAAANERSWQTLCAGSPAGAACRVPLCARPPGPLACIAGRCSWAVRP